MRLETRALETRSAEKLDTRAYFDTRTNSINPKTEEGSIPIKFLPEIKFIISIDLLDNTYRSIIKGKAIDRGTAFRLEAFELALHIELSKSGPKFLKLSPARPVARLSIRARSSRKS